MGSTELLVRPSSLTLDERITKLKHFLNRVITLALVGTQRTNPENGSIRTQPFVVNGGNPSLVSACSVGL